MKPAKFIAVALCVLFFFTSCMLVSRILSSNRERAHIAKKIEELTVKSDRLLNEFGLKQDYMRKIISDERISDMIIREKTGLSKANEIIFKFTD